MDKLHTRLKELRESEGLNKKDNTESIIEKKNELIKLFKYIEIWEDGRIECTLR